MVASKRLSDSDRCPATSTLPW
jgi:hypothetical protein